MNRKCSGHGERATPRLPGKKAFMGIFYKLLKQDKNSREGVIVTVSALGIFVNFTVATVKILIGVITSSIAVISEGINNASDSISSLLTIVGTKLSGMHPTKRHPFGFGRIEYLTSLVIAGIILVSGVELLISSVELIFEPSEISVDYVTVIIIAVSAVIKLLLGVYTAKQGKRVGSDTLVAVGTDSKNDCIVSAVTVVSALVFILCDFSIDAYAGIITSLFVLKAGFDILKETLADILGHAGDETELAAQLYKVIRSEPIVLNAADMMLHNYGPDRYSGSVNIEIDHDLTIGEAYAQIHALQLRIMHEYNITMVFGMYAVDRDHEIAVEMRERIAEFVRGQEHVESYHALYIDPATEDIYVDFVVDYKLDDWNALRAEFTEYMAKLYPGKRLELVIETNYV